MPHTEGAFAGTCVVLNPEAGRGRARGLLPSVKHAFPGAEFRVTTSVGEELRTTSDALAGSVDRIVAVGGDGTCTGVATAILRSGKQCLLAVLPCGTGNDFAKTLGVTNFTPDDIARLIERRDVSIIDVGVADDNYFLNSCGFGFDASVLAATKRVRFLNGNAVYIYAALTQLFTYRGINVSTDGAANSATPPTLMVTVSNGQWLGGAFRIAPHASAIDGKLDVVFFSDSNVFQRVRLFAGALRGTHLGLPSVNATRTQGMTLTFTEPPAMEVDGELREARSTSVKIECLPRALSVVAAPGAIR